MTGASTADAAVILIDATRVSDGALLPQTRRHSALARLLGIQHIAVAVNKLDQLDFSPAVFDTIVGAYRALAERLGLPDVTTIPVSALYGDNVVTRSANTRSTVSPSRFTTLASSSQYAAANTGSNASGSTTSLAYSSR